jgi:hypothetical protein
MTKAQQALLFGVFFGAFVTTVIALLASTGC